MQQREQHMNIMAYKKLVRKTGRTQTLVARILERPYSPMRYVVLVSYDKGQRWVEHCESNRLYDVEHEYEDVLGKALQKEHQA